MGTSVEVFDMEEPIMEEEEVLYIFDRDGTSAPSIRTDHQHSYVHYGYNNKQVP